MIKRESERISDESESIEEIALPCAVGTDKKGKLCRADIARGNALIVAERNACEKASV